VQSVKQPMTTNIWKRIATGRHSIIDVREIELNFEFTEGAQLTLENPLGTDYDNADIFLGPSKEPMDSSAFLLAWDENEDKYAGKTGLWLSEKNGKLIISYGPGNKASAPDFDLAIFFPVDESCHGRNHSLRLVVTCMN